MKLKFSVFSKHLNPHHSHIKEISVLKAYWANMLKVCWGEHCLYLVYDIVVAFIFANLNYRKLSVASSMCDFKSRIC